MHGHGRPRAVATFGGIAMLAAAIAVTLTACASERAPTVGPTHGSGAQSTAKPTPTPVTLPGQTKPPVAPASGSPFALPVDVAMLATLRGDWSATPVDVSGDFIGVVDRACRAASEDGLELYELQIVDARGEELVNAIYVGVHGGNYGCQNLWIDPFGDLQPPEWGTGADPSEGHPQPGPDEVIAWYGTHQEAPRSMVTWAGLVGRNVAEVRFTADGKPDIVATMMNGWFAAWFPDDWSRLTLRGYDARGTEVYAALDW